MQCHDVFYINPAKWKNTPTTEPVNLQPSMCRFSTEITLALHLHKHCAKNQIFQEGFLQETADLVTFTEEIPNRKLHFLCSEIFSRKAYLYVKSGVKSETMREWEV